MIIKQLICVFAGNFQGVCTLFYHFLMNVKIADYTVTDLTFTSVTDLLVVMETEILKPLLNQIIAEKEVSNCRLALLF